MNFLIKSSKLTQKSPFLAMADKNWELAVKLRGRSFERNLETYKMLTRLKPPKDSTTSGHGVGGYTMAVMHIGAPACGMNAGTYIN